MQILPNEQVRIKNFQTGEERIVTPNELSNYGPNLIDQYNKYLNTQSSQASLANTSLNIQEKQKALEQDYPTVGVLPPIIVNTPTQSAAVSYLASNLEKVKGSDNYVSPQDYAKNRSVFISKGGDPKKFDDYFAYLRNPDNPNYLIDPASLTATEQKKLQTREEAKKASDNTLATLDDIENTWKNMPSLEKRLPQFVVNAFPGIAPNRTAINSTFFTNLEGDLRKAIIGGRITQQEIQWIRNAILPMEYDTEQSMQAKLNAVRIGIRRKIVDPNYTIGTKETSGPNNKVGKYIIEEIK